VRTPLLILSGLACVAAPSAAPAGAQTTVGPLVTLPDSASAAAPGTPYPSPVTVTGEGIVTDVNVRISNFTHDFPQDADILLIGPGGQSTLLLSDAGGAAPASNVDLVFDDEAPGTAPDPLVSGSYRPTDVPDPFPDLFPSPAPDAPFDSVLSVFDNTLPNGVWSLYVVDDDPGAGGHITGWRVSILDRSPRFVAPQPGAPPVTEGPGAVPTVSVNRAPDGAAGTVGYSAGPPPTTGAPAPATPGSDFEPVSGTLSFAPGETTKTISIPIVDDARFESSEQFWLTFGDSRGDARLGSTTSTRVTIRDDDPVALRLGGKRLQRPLRRRAVTVLAWGTPASRLTATGTIGLPRGGSVQLKTARGYALYDEPRRLDLRLRPAGRRKLRRAFGVRRRLAARLTVTAANEGRSTVKSLRVKLRP
jgi:subtilisin-like proprotein convertase family protein